MTDSESEGIGGVINQVHVQVQNDATIQLLRDTINLHRDRIDNLERENLALQNRITQLESQQRSSRWMDVLDTEYFDVQRDYRVIMTDQSARFIPICVTKERLLFDCSGSTKMVVDYSDKGILFHVVDGNVAVRYQPEITRSVRVQVDRFT